MFVRQYGKAVRLSGKHWSLSPAQGVAINIFSALFLDGNGKIHLKC